MHNPGLIPFMYKRPRRSSLSGRREPSARAPGSRCPPRLRDRRSGARGGQAYTEYLIILLFGVFLCLGVAVVDQQLMPEELRIVDRLYGYMFDYYAGVANFLNLPIF